jgi:hypothetical protein
MIDINLAAGSGAVRGTRLTVGAASGAMQRTDSMWSVSGRRPSDTGYLGHSVTREWREEESEEARQLRSHAQQAAVHLVGLSEAMAATLKVRADGWNRWVGTSLVCCEHGWECPVQPTTCKDSTDMCAVHR